MACLPIGHQALVAHQIKYLEAHGLFKIYVVIQHDSFKRVKEYLKENFEADARTNVTLVVVQEEETESAIALKLMQQLQREQEPLFKDMPEYERAVLRQNTASGLPMDYLQFDSEELMIMEGTAFLDFDLSNILNEHYLTRSTLTSVV